MAVTLTLSRLLKIDVANLLYLIGLIKSCVPQLALEASVSFTDLVETNTYFHLFRTRKFYSFMDSAAELRDQGKGFIDYI